jgi:murein DD-endopeptidase MepM/ murein hydrolase activator NlpD
MNGKAFPLARSNFLSLIEIFDDWHAPRLRLVNGTWLLVGVHEGIDIAVEPGTPVLAMEPGTVENTGWTFYSGRRVGVRGVDGRYYFYAHLSVIEPGIAPGAPVAAGSVLGLAGNTGYGEPGHRDEFPPHLHFGIEDGAEWINPHPTLVSLYQATVKGDRRAQAALDRLLSAGETEEWSRLADSTYLDLEA